MELFVVWWGHSLRLGLEEPGSCFARVVMADELDFEMCVETRLWGQNTKTSQLVDQA